MDTSCHTNGSLLLRPLLAVRARPLHCRTPALQLQHSRHCTAPKTPSVHPRGTEHPSLSLYIRSPRSITPICRIINDLVRNNPNTLRPHHRSETNPTASPASTTLGDSPQQQVLFSGASCLSSLIFVHDPQGDRRDPHGRPLVPEASLPPSEGTARLCAGGRAEERRTGKLRLSVWSLTRSCLGLGLLGPSAAPGPGQLQG